MISAKVLAKSIHPDGDTTLTTMQITMHRFVLAEFNTHRMFSRSFRSSRAVPAKRLLQEVRENPALPVTWLSNQPGMQGGRPLDFAMQSMVETRWREAAESAADYAEDLMNLGLHKSWVNRILEPYLFVHGVVTSTSWNNFFALRCHEDAQPEIKALADAMKVAYYAVEGRQLKHGEWHLPYVEDEERARLIRQYGEHSAESAMIVCSVARCARASYWNFEGKPPSVEEDHVLYNKLVGSQPMHASPAEHQGTPDKLCVVGPPNNWHWEDEHLAGNLGPGWIQYRKRLPGEFVDG